MTMTREQARQHVNGLLPHELTKAPKRISGHDTFICPFCGNGGGLDGTGISTKDGKRYTCFKGCFTSLDYLDILKKQQGTDKESDIFRLYNLEIGGCHAFPSARTTPKPEPPQEDFSAFFLQAHKALQESTEAKQYLHGRGISIETANRFKLGYVEKWVHPSTPQGNPTARVIVPRAKNSYMARAIDPDTKTFTKPVVGKQELFNLDALASDAPYIFIVEGEFDALGIIDVGGQAVGLGSTNNWNKLIKSLAETPPVAKLVLSLDTDGEGQKKQAEIKAELEILKISFLEANISGEYSDPNEHLQNDRMAFAELVADPTRAARLEYERCKAEYMEKNAVVGYLNAFMGNIADSVNTPAIPTGFDFLDDCLDGGLYEGLYVIGAISSLGKTSLCLQIADQIAQQGNDMLIFSLEMSRYELISKSLSRLTIMADKGKNEQGYHFARAARQITAGAKYKLYNQREKDLIKNAVAAYGDEYAPRLFIHEGMGDIGAETVKGIVKEHISFTGNRPIVLIDYLQILAPYDIRATDKQNTDKAVLELKRLSRDYKIPV